MIINKALRPQFRKQAFFLLLLLAFLYPVASSFYFLFTGAVKNPDLRNPALIFNLTNLFKLVVIGVLIYVLARQGRTLKEFGFGFSFRDLWHTVPLTLTVYFLTFLMYFIYYLLIHQTINAHNVELLRTPITIWYILFIVVNPLWEELLVRAYTITEVEYLFNSTWLAGLVSVAIQTSYHFYQGLLPPLFLSVVFLVYTLYYIRYRRIGPVIISHLILDSVAMLVNAK